MRGCNRASDYISTGEKKKRIKLNLWASELFCKLDHYGVKKAKPESSCEAALVL